MTGEDWRDQALCAQVDHDMFFPEHGASTANAKRVCQGCPVRFECLEAAVTAAIKDGVWGGTSPGERKKLISQRRRMEAA